jgi:hypothetical protein
LHALRRGKLSFSRREEHEEGNVPRLTGIMQSISVFLELDSGICAIAE